MSHFAEIDKNNVVIRVIVGDNNMPNEGYDWIVENLGGTWVRTSYNSNFRKNFASIGYIYDQDRDAFIPPKPFNSWILNEETCNWTAPVEYPSDGAAYRWDEEQLDWTLINFSE